MTYKFEKKDADITILSYGEKQFEIKKDVRLIKDFQDLNARARKRMLIDLSKEGISTKDLIIEKKEGNKTIYDNSNAKEMEDECIKEVTYELLDELCMRFFKMPLNDICEDLRLETEEQINDFNMKFIEAMTGKQVTPS